MSQENLEIVQRFFKAVERALQTRRGAMLDAATAGDIPPDAAEAFGYMHPEAEWNPAFSGETYRGQREMGRGWDELLEAARLALG